MQLSEAMRECVPTGKFRGWPIEAMIRDHFPELLKVARSVKIPCPFKRAMETVKASAEFRQQLAKHRRNKAVDRMLWKWAMR